MKCEYCGKEYKTEKGLKVHVKKCSKKPNDLAVVEETVKCEIVNYYEGHSRRKTKLEGLLTRTLNPIERNKIQRMINEC